MPTRNEFLPHGAVREPVEKAAGAALDYPATEVGSVGNISVYYATSLGAPGKNLADGLLKVVSGPYDDMESYFGVAGGAVTVVVAPLSGNNNGSAGAYHYGCDFNSGGTLYLDATFALPNAVDVGLALYVAELSECFMGAQGRGWGCGYSNGEGLSRVSAEIDTPAGSFPSWGVTGPSWVAAGYPDWVTQTEQTDRDYVSTGCAVLYLYWMLSLGYTAPTIIRAAGDTLAANYKTLTGKDSAYADLKAAVQAVTVTSDNPFRPFIRPRRKTFQPLDQNTAYVLGSNGNLWHETGPWGKVPPSRQQVDGGVAAFQALSATEAYVLGTDGNLWHETGPWGKVPPSRQQVDGNVFIQIGRAHV